MQKVSIRRLSVLGLVLMVVSVITAAVMPGKSNEKAIKFDSPGSLTFSTVLNDGNLVANHSESISCELDTGVITAVCTVTVATETSEATGPEHSSSLSCCDENIPCNYPDGNTTVC